VFTNWPLFGVIALPMAVLLAGAALAWAGWRGRRVGDHPTCRRCGFDLFARPEGSRVCPECGADLERPRATVAGVRTRRPSLLLAGAAVALAGGVRLTTDLRREVAQDPNAFKPTWWLVREARGADPVRRDDALVELGSRLEHGRLSQPTIDALTERALALQADASLPWAAVWGDWVERALLAGKLSNARRERYFRQAMAPWFAELLARPRVRRGDPFPLLIKGQPGPRLGGRPSFGERDQAILFDGVPLAPAPEMNGRRPDRFPVTPNRSEILPAEQVPYNALRDGRHTVVIVGAHLCSAPGQSLDSQATTVPYHLETAWELVPADAPVVEMVDDPSLLESIRPLVAAGVELIDGPGPGTNAVVRVSFNRLPVGVAYDVILRSGETEWPAGSVCAPAGVYTWRGSYGSPGAHGGTEGPIDVVLRPNPVAAVETTDVVRVWNHELVLPNVLVTRRTLQFPPGTPGRTGPAGR
jgi:hypothetical protein